MDGITASRRQQEFDAIAARIVATAESRAPSQSEFEIVEALAAAFTAGERAAREQAVDMVNTFARNYNNPDGLSAYALMSLFEQLGNTMQASAPTPEREP